MVSHPKIKMLRSAPTRTREGGRRRTAPGFQLGTTGSAGFATMKLFDDSHYMQLQVVRKHIRVDGSAGSSLILLPRHGKDFVTEKNAWLIGRVDDESLKTALLHAFCDSQRCESQTEQ